MKSENYLPFWQHPDLRTCPQPGEDSQGSQASLQIALSFNLYLDLRSYLFPLGFATKILYASSITHMRNLSPTSSSCSLLSLKWKFSVHYFVLRHPQRAYVLPTGRQTKFASPFPPYWFQCYAIVFFWFFQVVNFKKLVLIKILCASLMSPQFIITS
jgi:hypothetical protein